MHTLDLTRAVDLATPAVLALRCPPPASSSSSCFAWATAARSMTDSRSPIDLAVSPPSTELTALDGSADLLDSDVTSGFTVVLPAYPRR